MLLNQNTNNNYTARQLKLPLEIEKLIDISDPVYTFCEVMDHIDLSGYFVEKGYKTGRPRCDEQKLLKVILFAFMENGVCDENSFVSGCGHRKSIQQKQYQELEGYLKRLKTYVHHIEICGNERNSYSKTDQDATFMRLKRDYMGNDQLLPAYNLQAAICDEYIAVIDVKPYASDMECFVPLM